MRVLFISTVAPYPKNVGKKIVLGGFFDYFKKVCVPEDFQMMCFESVYVTLGVDVTVLDKPNLLQKILNLVLSSLLTQRKSFQESLFWSSGALRRIEMKITVFCPDVVIFDTVRTGQYLSHLKHRSFKSILYMDDLFSVRYRRILRAMEDYPEAVIDAMGNFGSNIPGFLLPFYRSSTAIKRFLLEIERHLVEKTEYQMPKSFDLALLISQDEVFYLKTRAGLDNVFSVSPFLRVDNQRKVGRSWSGQPEFVFLGSLNLAHNAFSIENFIEYHMEEMLAAMPECVVRIIGKFPSENLVRLAERYDEHVILDGFVEDLDALLAGCAGMIVPLLFGSGVKIKVIDAVRIGIPVISTVYGVEGISVKESGGIIVEDDLTRFANLCVQLLFSEDNKRHSDLSRQIYLDNYSAEAVARQYEQVFHA
jgi:polysaccharide biosynthesis protein PslH